MKLPEFLIFEASGEIHLKDHRISLFHLVHYYNEGHSPEMLVCRYPTLPLALVYKVIAFYLDNQTDVDEYVANCNTLMRQQRAGNAVATSS